MASLQTHRFHARHVLLRSLVFSGFAFAVPLVAPLVTSGPLFAAEEPAGQTQDEGTDAVPQVDNAKYHFVGRVSTNNVFVKAGPTRNSYSTLKLDKGAEVTVIGIKGDWLKIVPPAGSFSYVPQAYVTRRGDGTMGRVNSTLNVRAGSALNGIKTTIQTKLEEGQDVKILGDQDEYYKVAPPEGAYLFIDKQYVTPERRVSEPAIAEKGAKGVTSIAKADGGLPKADGDQPATTQSTDTGDVAITEQPGITKGANATGANGRDQIANAAEPTTKPAFVAAIEQFTKLEAEFEIASRQPVVDQPIEKLTEGYTALIASNGLTGSAKQMADARLVALKMRADARTELQKFAKGKEEMNKRRQALVEEKKEIDTRIKQTEVSLYTAVGTLRVSSLQSGQQTLYRLTDPNTGRTVVYIRSNDPKYSGLLNQFVGVKGNLATDERLKMKIITPTDAEQVDPVKVNTTIIATVTPPSMLAAAASVDTHETTGGN